MRLTRHEQQVAYLKQRLSTARTKEILLLTQILELKEELRRLNDAGTGPDRPGGGQYAEDGGGYGAIRPG